MVAGLAAASLAPKGSERWVSGGEDEEEEEALHGGGDGEEVLKHQACVRHSQESKYPAETCKHRGIIESRDLLCG